MILTIVIIIINNSNSNIRNTDLRALGLYRPCKAGAGCSVLEGATSVFNPIPSHSSVIGLGSRFRVQS